jgi:hypothetical protein
MQDYYLKFTSEQHLWNTLERVGLAVFREEQGKHIPINTNLDVIGTIYKATGQMLTGLDGFPYPEMLPVDGYHANLRGSLTEEQKAQLPLIAAPATPSRVWA